MYACTQNGLCASSGDESISMYSETAIIIRVGLTIFTGECSLTTDPGF